MIWRLIGYLQIEFVSYMGAARPNRLVSHFKGIQPSPESDLCVKNELDRAWFCDSALSENKRKKMRNFTQEDTAPK